MSDFSFPVRVYYEDTDAGRVVYHANYLHFMERARTEWLRALSFSQTTLREQLGVLFVVRQVSVDYRAPAYLDDELRVDSRVAPSGRTALCFDQHILRVRDERLICEGRVVVVCVDGETFRPTAVPATILNRLQATE